MVWADGLTCWEEDAIGRTVKEPNGMLPKKNSPLLFGLTFV
jgi:hypothetical protein